MNPILIVAESRYGHCAKIADFIAEHVRSRGGQSHVEQATTASSIAVSAFAGVVVIAPIYHESHPASIADFVRAHAYALSIAPSVFISVSMGSVAKTPRARRNAAVIAEGFLESTGWREPHLLMAGGCIAYPDYTAGVRRVVQLTAWRYGLPTDTSRRHELTDWDAVAATVDTLLSSIEVVAHRSPLRVA